MDELSARELLQAELSHWKQVAETLEDKVRDLEQNEVRLISIATNWQQVAESYKRDAQLWEHTAIKAHRRFEEHLSWSEEKNGKEF